MYFMIYSHSLFPFCSLSIFYCSQPMKLLQYFQLSLNFPMFPLRRKLKFVNIQKWMEMHLMREIKTAVYVPTFTLFLDSRQNSQGEHFTHSNIRSYIFHLSNIFNITSDSESVPQEICLLKVWRQNYIYCLLQSVFFICIF